MAINNDLSSLYGSKTKTFNPDKPTYVITHGFQSNGRLNEDGGLADNDWVDDMASSIKSRDPEANVIVVNWENEAAPDNKSAAGAAAAHVLTNGRTISPSNQSLELTDFYETAASNTTDVGERLGKELLEKYGVNPENTQLIGHSLGAHVSGAAGSYIQNNHPKGTQVNSIIALDPAGPGYQSNDSVDMFWDEIPEQLDPKDAKNVVAIHSSELLGNDAAVGKLDLYVNYDDLFQPNSKHVVDNHAYAHQLFISLLNGDVYNQPNGTSLNLESLYETGGTFNVDTKNSPVIKRDITEIGDLRFNNKKNNKIGYFRQTRQSEWESIKEKYLYLEKITTFVIDEYVFNIFD